MAQASRRTHTLRLEGRRKSTKAEKARAKVQRLLDELTAIRVREELDLAVSHGLELTWEGLRRRAGCGTDALTVNNPDLHKQITAQKERLETLVHGGERSHRKGDGETIAGLKRRLAAAITERDLAHVANLDLLDRIANLERELSQTKRASF
ncbi:hypothetical protein RHAB21_01663 [Pseudorhizobium halotolerans]|uniref:Transposase n=1 Tax=Pseudorhizobium halotolerans TaxID=1233081 RepID=A0ABN7JI22_9HYPH|nr:hypothetical protein RHAB21_01663 [Pseudorhizobium halotolerans]